MDEGLGTKPWLPVLLGTLVVLGVWQLRPDSPPPEPLVRKPIVVHPPSPGASGPRGDMTAVVASLPGSRRTQTVSAILDPPNWPERFDDLSHDDPPLQPWDALAALTNPTWPDVASIDPLLRGTEKDRYESMVDQADRDGLTAEAAMASRDPWRILATLEVERLRAYVDAERRKAAWLAEKGVKEPSPSGYGPHVPRSVGGLDWTTVHALVERLAHAPARLRQAADLYTLYTILQDRSIRKDWAPVRPIALSLLRETDDPAIAHEALTALRTVAYDVPELAPEFTALAEEFPDEEARIAQLAVGTAVLAGQFEVAGAWLDRTVAEGTCRCSGVHDEPARSRCLDLCSLHIKVGPELAAAGWATSPTWERRMHAAILACCKERFKAEGTWENGWVWTSATDEDAAACIASAADEPPYPEPGQQVRLIVSKSTSVDLSGGRGVPPR